MKFLKNSTYDDLILDIRIALEEAKQWHVKFLEMQERKDYIKGEFIRVSGLLSESQNQRQKLATAFATELERYELLNDKLDVAQDTIKALTKKKSVK